MGSGERSARQKRKMAMIVKTLNSQELLAEEGEGATG
jgi:hypothetical protein